MKEASEVVLLFIWAVLRWLVSTNSVVRNHWVSYPSFQALFTFEGNLYTTSPLVCFHHCASDFGDEVFTA